MAAAAGRRSSVSISLSTASDPFATVGQITAGRPLVQLLSPSGNVGPRRPNPRQPTRQGSRRTGQGRAVSSGRGSGYLVIPASALIQFLASRTRDGGFPNSFPGTSGTHSAGMQLGVGGSVRPSGARPMSLPQVGAVQGFRRVIGGTGPGYNIVPIGQPLSRGPLLNVLGIAGHGGVAAASPVILSSPAGVAFLGRPPGYFAGLPGTITGSRVPTISAPSIDLLNNQGHTAGASGTNGNGSSSIIIQDAGSTSGQQGGSIVIGGSGGTITIKGNFIQGGLPPPIEPEEIENEGKHKKNKNRNSGSSAKNSTAVNKPIVLRTGGAKSQTIVIGSAGGTFTIGDQASGGGNATFILDSGTTPRMDAK